MFQLVGRLGTYSLSRLDCVMTRRCTPQSGQTIQFTEAASISGEYTELI